MKREREGLSGGIRFLESEKGRMREVELKLPESYHGIRGGAVALFLGSRGPVKGYRTYSRAATKKGP